MKQWMIKRNGADLAKIAKRYHISEIFAEILVKRGLYDWEAMDDYLYPSVEKLHSAHDICDLDYAVQLIRQNIKEGKCFQIIGDYDVDGVMSTVILYLGLKRMGADVCWRIPHREKDGYGIRSYMAEQAYEKGVGVIITCDNGISATEAVEKAKELGMTVIVTDHHEVPIDNETGRQLLPKADAVVDAKRQDCEYPWKEMCGAGIAYRLVEVLLEEARDEKLLDELLSMAAIATVCDVVPLQRENRIIVSRGLELLGDSTNSGLSSLIRHLELRRGVDSGTIGFRIGPCLNAAGRLEDASLGVELLLERDRKRADELALRLIQLNEERKQITEDAVRDAVRTIEEENYLEHNVLVVYVEGCPESVAGIVAGKIREKYYRPTMIITSSRDRLKGSGRSVPGYHMQGELNRCKEYLIEYGGHAMAAGFSLKEEQLVPLRLALYENCTLKAEELVEKITVDREVALWENDENLVRELELLQPVGEKNEGALFARRGLEVLSVKLRGREGQVGSFRVLDAGRCYTIVDFDIRLHMKKVICDRYSENMWQDVVEGRGKGCIVDILYKPKINEMFGGLQYTVIDCR